MDPHPFVPQDPATLDERCQEVFSIQTAGLAKRLEHTGIRRVVLGLSGGLDSTLALLVAARTFDLLRLPRDGVLAVTLPGFGTTGRSLEQRAPAGRGAGRRASARSTSGPPAASTSRTSASTRRTRAARPTRTCRRASAPRC